MILFTAGIGPYFYIVGTDVHRSVDWIVQNNTFKNIASPARKVALLATTLLFIPPLRILLLTGYWFRKLPPYSGYKQYHCFNWKLPKRN